MTRFQVLNDDILIAEVLQQGMRMQRVSESTWKEEAKGKVGPVRCKKSYGIPEMVRWSDRLNQLWSCGKTPTLNWKPLGQWGVGHCQSGSFKKEINLLPPPVFEPLFLRLQPVPQSLYPLRYSVIVGFRRGCTEFFRLLCYYGACSFRDHLSVPSSRIKQFAPWRFTNSPETSVLNQLTSRNNPEDGRIRYSGSLTWRYRPGVCLKRPEEARNTSFRKGTARYQESKLEPKHDRQQGNYQCPHAVVGFAVARSFSLRRSRCARCSVAASSASPPVSPANHHPPTLYVHVSRLVKFGPSNYHITTNSDCLLRLNLWPSIALVSDSKGHTSDENLRDVYWCVYRLYFSHPGYATSEDGRTWKWEREWDRERERRMCLDLFRHSYDGITENDEQPQTAQQIHRPGQKQADLTVVLSHFNSRS
jgi:hypothetical protein